MTGIDTIPFGSLTPSALLALVVLFVLTDRLVWHKRLEEKQRQIDVLNEQLAQQGKQISLLLGESVPTTTAVLNALHRAAQQESS
jgi:hypothetical protein